MINPLTITTLVGFASTLVLAFVALKVSFSSQKKLTSATRDVEEIKFEYKVKSF